MNVIVLGQCRKVAGKVADFNFKGHWKAWKISKISVESDYAWSIKADYVLKLRVIRVENEVMWTQLVAARPL